MSSYIIGAIIFGICLSLFFERAPAGGFRVSRRLTIVKEFWWFIKERKAWWLTPIVIIFLILSVFIVLTENSVVLPFIYAL